jgi:hypothetical protein
MHSAFTYDGHMPELFSSSPVHERKELYNDRFMPVPLDMAVQLITRLTPPFDRRSDRPPVVIELNASGASMVGAATLHLGMNGYSMMSADMEHDKAWASYMEFNHQEYMGIESRLSSREALVGGASQATKSSLDQADAVTATEALCLHGGFTPTKPETISARDNKEMQRAVKQEDKLCKRVFVEKVLRAWAAAKIIDAQALRHIIVPAQALVGGKKRKRATALFEDVSAYTEDGTEEEKELDDKAQSEDSDGMEVS